MPSVKKLQQRTLEALKTVDSRSRSGNCFYGYVWSNTTHDKFGQSHSGVKYAKNGVVEWTELLFGMLSG